MELNHLILETGKWDQWIPSWNRCKTEAKDWKWLSSGGFYNCRRIYTGFLTPIWILLIKDSTSYAECALSDSFWRMHHPLGSCCTPRCNLCQSSYVLSIIQRRFHMLKQTMSTWRGLGKRDANSFFRFQQKLHVLGEGFPGLSKVKSVYLSFPS